MEEDTIVIKDKRIRIAYDIDKVLEDLFKVNEGYKLYNSSLVSLNKANEKEVEFIRSIKGTVKELRKMLADD